MSNLMEIREMLANDLVSFGSYAQERADEYIEAIMQRVEKQTEKRIIKLLEADAEDWHTHSERCEIGFCHCPAVRLIKGETK